MLLNFLSSQFNFSFSNVNTIRPVAAATPYGGTNSVGLNTIPTIQTLAASTDLTEDIYTIVLCFNNYGSSNSLRNALANIWVDPAGTGVFNASTLFIENLMISSATSYHLGTGGVWYYFPVFIPKGSSVLYGARGTVAVTNLLGCAAWFYGKPKNPEQLRFGTRVDTYGIDLANNRGTSITIGTTARGAFTSLGTASTNYFWAQSCFGHADTSQTAAAIHVDIAHGSSTTVNDVIIKDQYWNVTAAEQIGNQITPGPCDVKAGDNIYGRAWSSSAADTLPNIGCYMVT